ncbi:ROK family transcriptional regulator [Paenalkalicoccus suaedae]|uniref:ROK family transcriptional regulator n=1 Tax=Paenalkalicoccus suaedae TaxID=2592382 RepID=A0A859FBE7_9BACI|nr:ROK family transcriptional regulator [Paenalkalicoccus suaedae]QKS70148.1 ROK family transcriptional regulator [Paenalkalicoccus suaedae]
MAGQAGSFKLMKSLNRALILQTIRESEPISRSEIAKRTKLTPPTVTNIVNELLEEELVLESKVGSSNGGRKPIMLTIHADSRYTIGVDVGVKKIRLSLMNMNARIDQTKRVEMPERLTNDTFLSLLETSIEDFLEEIGAYKDSVIGVGIAMHGIVDATSGESIHAPTLKLRHVPIKASLEAALSLPVFVENDAKAMALGEKWFGAGKDYSSFISVNIGEGVGAGVVIRDKLWSGATGLAGEIGHTVLHPDGPTCSCGRKGCLQAFVSGEALRLQAAQAPEESALKKIKEADGAAVYEAAKSGDDFSQRVLREAGKYLGLGLVNIVHFMNPKLVIIGGGVAKAEEYLEAPMKQVLGERALTEDAGETEVVFSPLGEKAALIGAGTLVLSHLFHYEQAGKL